MSLLPMCCVYMRMCVCVYMCVYMCVQYLQIEWFISLLFSSTQLVPILDRPHLPRSYWCHVNDSQAASGFSSCFFRPPFFFTCSMQSPHQRFVYHSLTFQFQSCGQASSFFVSLFIKSLAAPQWMSGTSWLGGQCTKIGWCVEGSSDFFLHGVKGYGGKYK